MNWKKLWETRGNKFQDESLSVIDGFDHGVGKLNESMIKQIVDNIVDNLTIRNKSVVLEVGCGGDVA